MPLPARCLAVAGLCLTLAGPALAAQSPAGIDHDEALRLRQAGAIVPFATVLESALGRYPEGRLLETRLQRDRDALIYDVELLTVDGRVRHLRIDARDGRILGDENQRDH